MSYEACQCLAEELNKTTRENERLRKALEEIRVHKLIPTNAISKQIATEALKED